MAAMEAEQVGIEVTLTSEELVCLLNTINELEGVEHLDKKQMEVYNKLRKIALDDWLIYDERIRWWSVPKH